MSTPDEKRRALLWAIKFLESIMTGDASKRIPHSVRNEAYRVLRHYPSTVEIERFKMLGEDDVRI